MLILSRWLLCLTLFWPSIVVAADKQDVVFDITLDMDRNGKLDRAALVLVGPGRADFSELTKDRYLLSEGEHVDLLIYLNSAAENLDLNKPPTFRKQKLLGHIGLNTVLPLAASKKGSLSVLSSNGFGNTLNSTETLTIVYRGDKFQVAGWAYDFYNSRDEESDHCSVNYLSGKAVKRVNDGKDTVLKGKFTPILLADWTVASVPAACSE